MKKNWIKYITAFISILLIRLIPFRAPNVEPLMAVIMPVGKKYGAIMAFIFGSLSIILYDALTSGIGVWTFFTALTYALIGFFSYSFLRNRSGWESYAIYSIIATLAYDIVTGLLPGPIFFHQPFLAALIGQVPFTAIHLISNVIFAVLLSYPLELWFKRNEHYLTEKYKKNIISI